MTELNSQLLNLILANKSINEISQTMSLSHKQIFQRLKNLQQNGYCFDREYTYKGDIFYKKNKDIYTKDRDIRIEMPNDVNEIQAILISDLHIGCVKERLDALDQIYDYCIKNGINIIINAGDLINGKIMGPDNKNKISDYEAQIKYLLKNYPFDKNILNFTCLGNHDIDALQNEGIDLATALYNNRHDIIPLGYAEGIIGIKNEKIVVKHPIKSCPNQEENPYFVKGHAHKMAINKGSDSFSITVPTLSDLSYNNSCFAPSAVEITIKFYSNLFQQVYIKHLVIFNDKIYSINEANIFLSRKIKSSNNYINDTEDKKKDTTIKHSNENQSPKTKKLEKFKSKYYW